MFGSAKKDKESKAKREQSRDRSVEKLDKTEDANDNNDNHDTKKKKEKREKGKLKLMGGIKHKSSSLSEPQPEIVEDCPIFGVPLEVC